MAYDYEKDMDDTARLILMDVAKMPAVRNGTRSGFGVFREQMRAAGVVESVTVLVRVYSKYMGWDGRTFATHDIDTGLPLRDQRTWGPRAMS